MGTHGAIHVVFVLLFAGFVSGCATMKAYPGPDLPREQIAVIQGLNVPGIINISIAKIDGASVGTFEKDVAVIPGWHTVQLTYVGQQAHGIGVGKPIELRVFVKAGRVYRVRASTGNKTWQAWIEDTTSTR